MKSEPSSARHLNFSQFLRDRSAEISGLLKDLQADTKKKGHQGLPKSIRRRAMSHNKYRVPRRLRTKMEEQLSQAQTMQRVPKCRKHIRKRHKLAMAYRIRSDHCQWLSTHLWAAKRMRMKPYYGYKIAMTSNDKCFRTAYRHYSHGCCMVDLSYLQCLMLKHLNPGQGLPPSVIVACQLQNQHSDQLIPINIQRGHDLICPGFLVKCPSQSHTVLRIFFHPAALEETKQLEWGVGWQVVVENRQCDIYMLSGPTSAEELAIALRKYGVVESQHQFTNRFYGKKIDLSYYSRHQGSVKTIKPMVSLPVPPEKQLRQQYCNAQNISLRTKMLSLLTNLNSQAMQQEGDQEAKVFWDFYEQGQNKDLQKITFKVTLRSKYTHRRRNRLTKSEKKAVIEGKGSSKEKKQGVDKQRKIKGEIQQKRIEVIQPESNSQATPDAVMIGQAGHPAFPQGFLVFCSNEEGCRLWRILTHQRIKVVGRREWAHQHLQQQKPLFPQDYPTTKSYKIHQTALAKANFVSYSHFPAPKRPKYSSLNSPCPFRALPASSPLSVWVEMVGKGRCGQHYYICELLPADAQKSIAHLNNNKCPIIVSEPQVNTKISQGRPKIGTQEELQGQLSRKQPIRRIIGSLTSGGFIFSLRREGGLGFIDDNLLSHNYFTSSQGYCLLRKPTSPHYLLAHMRLL